MNVELEALNKNDVTVANRNIGSPPMNGDSTLEKTEEVKNQVAVTKPGSVFPMRNDDVPNSFLKDVKKWK